MENTNNDKAAALNKAADAQEAIARSIRQAPDYYSSPHNATEAAAHTAEAKRLRDEAASYQRSQPSREQWALMSSNVRAEYLAAGFYEPSQHEPRVLTGSNIRAESYYNLVQISKLTQYADPVRAAHAGQVFRVTRDECGNILTAVEVPKQTPEELAEAEAAINAGDGAPFITG